MVIVSKLVQTAMAMVSSTKTRTVNVNALHAGGLGFVPDDDNHEEVARCAQRDQRSEATMKSILGVSLLILLMPSAYAAALPGDSAEGKRLHDANCMGCHNTSIYTRKDRLIHSLDALKKRLGDCSHMANKEFSASETQNIIKYLNDQFYQFR
jgi:cytochrome c5